MTTKAERDKVKQVQEKCQALLTKMLRDEDNKYCVDCDAKGPRWASYNLGIFLCIRCAGIHRNLGVHISRVKSVNLDSWTPEQISCLQQMGNSRARAVYEANLPDNFRRPQTDSSLEAFIRAKYEAKKYIAKEWIQPIPPKIPVGWDMELDDKKKKEPKKRPTGTIELPAPVSMAKPKPGSGSNSANTTPKPIRAAEKPKQSPADALDLLGLDNPSQSAVGSEDPFGSFLSAPSQQLSGTIEQNSASNNVEQATKTEEENFFNQTVPTEEKKQQLTKDSILALYGQGSVTSQSTTMFGVPGGMYVNPQQSFQQPGMAQMNFSSMPNGQIHNSMMGNPGVMPGHMMQNGMFSAQPQGVAGQPVPTSSNPFFGMGSTPAQSFTNMPGLGQLQQQMSALNMGTAPGSGMMGQPLGIVGLGSIGAPMSTMKNPIGCSPIGQPAGQTLSNNLWQ